MARTLEFNSPDLGFLDSLKRLETRFCLVGRGSLGESFANLVHQAELGSITEDFDPDTWEPRNQSNTIGLHPNAFGQNKAINHAHKLENPDQISGHCNVIVLATDNLKSRSDVFHWWNSDGLNQDSMLIDMRSSAGLVRVITHSMAHEIGDQDPEKWEAYLKLKGWLYPQGNDLIEAEIENQEGSCNMRGSMMHTTTAVSIALQHLFRWHQGMLPYFIMQDQAPYTGSSFITSFGDCKGMKEDGLKDYSSTYSQAREDELGHSLPFRFRTHREEKTMLEAAEELL